MIFKHMSEYLKEKRNEIILMDDYAKEFLKAEVFIFIILYSSFNKFENVSVMA